MQSLESFPIELKRSRRLDISNLFYSTNKLPSLYENSSVQFIPFQKQRDGIGKLITKARVMNPQLTQLSMKTSRPVSQQLSKKKEHENDQDQKISKIVCSFFKKIDMQSKEIQRSKKIQRTGVVFIDKDRKNAKPSNEYYDVEIGLQKIKLRKKDCMINKQRRLRNNSLKQLREREQIMKRTMKEKVQSKLQKLQSKSQKKINTKKDDIDKISKTKLTFQHPQLKRYRQFKKLQIKIFSDYQVGHEKFKQKMQKSKLIAQQIKKQLQLQ